MQLNPVESSNIAAIGHDPDNNILHVQFKNGSRYAYHGVTAAEHDALANADSIGQHLHQHIKSRYTGVKQP